MRFGFFHSPDSCFDISDSVAAIKGVPSLPFSPLCQISAFIIVPLLPSILWQCTLALGGISIAYAMSMLYQDVVSLLRNDRVISSPDSANLTLVNLKECLGLSLLSLLPSTKIPVIQTNAGCERHRTLPLSI